MEAEVYALTMSDAKVEVVEHSESEREAVEKNVAVDPRAPKSI